MPAADDPAAGDPAPAQLPDGPDGGTIRGGGAAATGAFFLSCFGFFTSRLRVLFPLPISEVPLVFPARPDALTRAPRPSAAQTLNHSRFESTP